MSNICMLCQRFILCQQFIMLTDILILYYYYKIIYLNKKVINERYIALPKKNKLLELKNIFKI